MKTLFISVISICLFSLSLYAETYSVSVDAGQYERMNTPVSVQISGTRANENTSVSVKGPTGNWQPAQVEAMQDGSIRVWWIVDHLNKGQSAEYQIQLDKDSSNGMFLWKDVDNTPLDMMDLLFDGQPVLTYMHTPYDTTNVEETKKPFHHVYDPDGRRPITKGAGGRYSHHRGIYAGYSKCRVGGEVYDIWHASNGEHSEHNRVAKEFWGPVMGGHTVLIDWNDREGETFLRERRTLRVFAQPHDQRLIQLTTRLHSLRGRIELDGDRQHAGVQFRASQYVAENEKATRYLRPEQYKDLPADQQFNGDDYKDLPWNCLQFPIQERQYNVAYLTDPANPDDARFSERLYGRFGEFIPFTLNKNNDLVLRYRWWITADHEISRSDVDQKYQELASPIKVKLE